MYDIFERFLDLNFDGWREEEDGDPADARYRATSLFWRGLEEWSALGDGWEWQMCLCL